MKLLKAILVFSVVVVGQLSARDVTLNDLEHLLQKDRDIQNLSKELAALKIRMTQRTHVVKQQYILALVPGIQTILIQQGRPQRVANKEAVEIAKTRCAAESKNLENTLEYLTYKRALDSYDRDQTNKTGLAKQNSGQGFELNKQNSKQGHETNVLSLKGNIALTDKITTSAESDATRKHELDLLKLKQGFKSDDQTKAKLEQELFDTNKSLTMVRTRIASINRKIDSWELAGNANPVIAQKNLKKLAFELKAEQQKEADLDFRKKYLMRKL